jgi:hypothetical protein
MIDLVPKGNPDCSKFPEVNSGSHYPTGKSDPSSVVGVVDEAVLPSMDIDVRRYTYLGVGVRKV